MALPFSKDYPAVPFTQYSYDNPPIMPSIDVMPQVSHLKAFVISALANEISMKSQMNPARMFAYNLLSNNYWNNDYFIRAIRLTLDLLCARYLAGKYSSPELAIKETVDMVLSILTSQYIHVEFPELKAHLAGNVIDAAYQNIPAYNQIQQEINYMWTTNQGAQQNNMGGFAQAPMNAGYDPRFQVQQPPMYVGQPPMYPQPMGYPQPMMVHNPAPAFNNGGRSFGDNTNSFTNTSGTFDTRQDRFTKARPSSPEFVQPNQQMQQVQQQVPEDKPTELIIEGGSEMDRSMHQIQYFGEAYSADNVIRQNVLAKSSQELADIDVAPDLPIVSGDDVIVNKAWFSENNLDTAIVRGRIVKRANDKENGLSKIFRCFYVVNKVFVNDIDVKFYMSTLNTAKTFTELAVKIKSLTSSAMLKREDDDGANEYDCAKLLSFMSSIDITLTTLVNDYLKNRLRVTTTITSFVEDVSELESYLRRKYSGKHGNAFSKFEQTVIETMFIDADENTQDNICAEIDLPEDMYAHPLPVNYSLTYLFMDDRELGYKLGNEAVVINPATAPSLYRIAESLVEHKRIMGMDTLVDILITADGVRYNLYANAVDNREFLISKA